MAIKKKRKKILKKKFSKEIEYLNKLIKISINNIDGKSPELDSFFSDQAKRLGAEVDKLEQNQ